jgi:hypothetical protein
MAQYKVPQDVEADDKLIGPFSFRQLERWRGDYTH